MFPQLGRALNAAFRRVAGSIEALTDALIRGRGANIIAAAHIDGRRVARVTHGVILRAAPTLTMREARAWRDTAATHGRRAVRLAVPALEVGVSKQALAWYATTILRQSVWAGQDAESIDLAEAHDAVWKEWVRAFPRADHRDHHDALEGIIIPTNELFTLPGGRNAGITVYGPRDWDRVNDPGEWVECGHALRFSQTAERRRVTA